MPQGVDTHLHRQCKALDDMFGVLPGSHAVEREVVQRLVTPCRVLRVQRKVALRFQLATEVQR